MGNLNASKRVGQIERQNMTQEAEILEESSSLPMI